MDEIKIPSISTVAYDFFGYLLPGLFFVCLLVFEYDFSKALNYYIKHNHSFKNITAEASNYKISYLMKFLAWSAIPNDFKVVPFILFTIACYLIGHILASISSTLLEKALLTFFLGQPSNNLFKINRHPLTSWYRRPIRWLAADYCKPFDSNFILKFKDIIDERFDYQVSEHDYYWLSYTDIVRHIPAYHQRIQHFVSLYGFTRNVCAAFLLYIPLRLAFKLLYIVLGVPFQLSLINWVVLILYFITSLFLYTSYMKHYRRQTVELFYAFFSLHTEEETP